MNRNYGGTGLSANEIVTVEEVGDKPSFSVLQTGVICRPARLTQRLGGPVDIYTGKKENTLIIITSQGEDIKGEHPNPHALMNSLSVG